MVASSEISSKMDTLAESTSAIRAAGDTETGSGAQFLLDTIRNGDAIARSQRPPHIKAGPKVIQHAQVLADNATGSGDTWSVRTTGALSDNATVSADEDNCTYGRILSATAGTKPHWVKLTKPAESDLNAQAISPTGLGLDFVTAAGDAAVYVRHTLHLDASAIANLDKVYWQTLSAAPGGNTDLREVFDVWRSGADTFTEAGTYHVYTRPLDVDGANNARSRYADVNRVYYQINAEDADDAISVSFGGPQVMSAPNAGKFVCLRDDDGYADAFERAKIPAAYGVPVSFCVHGALVNDDGDDQGSYMGHNKLRALEDMGHLIVNHGWNKHAGDAQTGANQDLLDLTDAQIEEHIGKNRDWMIKHGYEAGANIWVVHQGNLSLRMIEVARRMGVQLISNTSQLSSRSSASIPFNFIVPPDGTTYHGVPIATGAVWHATETNKMRPGDVLIAYGHNLDIFIDPPAEVGGVPGNITGSTFDTSLERFNDLLAIAEDTTYGDRAQFVTLADLANGEQLR